ncbi:uncharacterized protein [Arachis hypogaea]|uniref:uncharacterized protein n=1 Tax=Arachis hypogaea TaxID=3818 RepID=UPI003B22811B
MAEFVVLRDSISYNMILGRGTISELSAVICTKLLMMKFITDRGAAGSIRGDLKIVVAWDNTNLDARIDDKPRPEPQGDLEKFRVGDMVDKFIFVNRNLPHELKEPLIKAVRVNSDLFAWTPADMPRVDPDFMLHRLAVRSNTKLVAQQRRKMSPKRANKWARQTANLLKAGFIQKLEYPTWLSNMVLVKKANGKWRMCVNYSNLNKACPKDSFSLPNIDARVDAT